MGAPHMISLPKGSEQVFAEKITIEDLFARQQELNAHVIGVQAQADEEGRELTEEERTHINECMNEFDKLEIDIQCRRRMDRQSGVLSGSSGRTVAPEDPATPENAVVASAIASGTKPQVVAPKPAPSATCLTVDVPAPSNYGKHGFNNIGEFALAVVKASSFGGVKDTRLFMNAPSATSSEGTSADGGYAVPPDFKAEIMRKVLGEASLLQYTDQQTTSSNSITFPVDETVPWQATGGVRVNWTAEGTQIQESKLALGEQTIKLEKLAALLPVTEELLQDAPAVSRYITSRIPEVLGYVLNNAILNGTGTGQPKGILGSSALVTAAAETGQAPDTVTFKNIVSMWSRMYSRGKSKAIWIMNPIVSEQLMLMQFPGAGTAIPVYLPPTGLSSSPYATLMGRPVVESEACAALGSKGDILLCDLSQYMSVMKSIGMRADVSMHLYFDYDLLTFRFIMRIGGKPWWTAPITGADGTTEYSAFVALAERARRERR